MSEQPAPGDGGQFDETLVHFPDLARARTHFIGLFKDRSPLVNLGYTSKQIAFVVPVLQLIEGEGVVDTHLRNKPYLTFENPDEPEAEAAYINPLPLGDGYYLSGFRDEGSRGWDQLSREERLIRQTTNRQPIIFNDVPGVVAHVALFSNDAPTDRLEYLIPQLHNQFFTNAPFGMKPENMLTKVAQAVGATGTFKAAWVDEETKNEFVARIDIPEEEEPYYVAYRKLRPLVDARGNMTPIGKKANSSESKVTQIFKARKQVVSGQLAPGAVNS